MSFTKGDLLTKTRKLVNGLAKVKPVWLKAMEKSPPAVFPRAEKKVERICLPEDVYINKFYKKHPESLHEDPIKICDFEPTPSRIFGCRVLELKELGVSEGDAIDVADTEYRLQKKAKKTAYKRLREIARLRGTKPPPNPYPSALKQIQAEEKKYVHDRFFNPRILEIVDKLKEQQAAEMQDRGRPGGMISLGPKILLPDNVVIHMPKDDVVALTPKEVEEYRLPLVVTDEHLPMVMPVPVQG